MANKETVADSDKKWQAENDARALMEAEVIKKDAKRFDAALKAADSMAKDKNKEAQAMNKIASLKPIKKIKGL